MPVSAPQGNALEAYHRQVQRAQEAERRREEAERKRWEVRGPRNSLVPPTIRSCVLHGLRQSGGTAAFQRCPLPSHP